jgi:site-specific DNA-adenine methylase
MKLATPLRYPGGKSRAMKNISPYIDFEGVKEFRDIFVGGGSVACYIAQNHPGLKIWINDSYEPLINFWRVLQKKPEQLITYLINVRQSLDNISDEIDHKQYSQRTRYARILFYGFEKARSNKDLDPIERAAQYYILNKWSFSGLGDTFTPRAVKENFSMNGILKLYAYSSLISEWKITNMDYTRCLKKTESSFVYADPPYDIKDFLYGENGSTHKGFDHSRLALNLEACNSKVLISYNDNTHIRDLYKDWEINSFGHTYTMRSDKEYVENQEKRLELIITR